MNVSLFARSFLLLGGLALFTGCDPIQGQLRVSKTFSAQSDENPHNCTPEDIRPVCGGPIIPRQFQVTPGNYSASFNMVARDRAVFQIRLNRNLTRNIELKIPNNNRLPTYSGPIELKGRQSGQPFDLEGSIHTTERYSPRHEGYESCTYTVTRRVCGRRGCWYEDVIVHGTRFVAYHYRYTDTALNLMVVQSGGQAADFFGERTRSEKIYEHTGICR